jgi:hypothetical protein
MFRADARFVSRGSHTGRSEIQAYMVSREQTNLEVKAEWLKSLDGYEGKPAALSFFAAVADSLVMFEWA